MKVSIFARDMRVDGVDYPQGTLYPKDLLKTPKEEQLRRNRMITEIEFEDVFDLLKRGATAPGIVLALVADMIEERERDLELLDKYLDRLTVPDVDEDEVEEVEEVVEVEKAVEAVEVKVEEVEVEEVEVEEAADDDEEDDDKASVEVEKESRDEKSTNLLGKIAQKFPFKE